MNYILENPGIDIEDIVPLEDNISPIIFFNSTAGATGSFIEFNGSSYSVPYDTTDGFTFSTSISLSTYGTNSILTKSIINDLLIDYITDNRDGTMSLMDSQMILTGNTGVVSQVSQTGTYSLTFNFTDIATNNLEGVIVNLNITS